VPRISAVNTFCHATRNFQPILDRIHTPGHLQEAFEVAYCARKSPSHNELIISAIMPSKQADITPYISVATPVFNAAATVGRTLDAMCRQTASFEHVVYDGGSSDATREIIESWMERYPLRLMRAENLGVYGNVANAHKTTKGEVMGWINGDDFYLPYTLSVVERIFKSRPDIEWITGIPSYYFEGEGLWGVHGMVPIYNQTLIRLGWYRSKLLGCLQQESMFWRRSLYERADGDAILRRYRYAADYHLWRAFARHAPLRSVGTVLSTFTFRAGQFSEVKRQEYDAECGVPKNAINLFALGFIFRGLYSNLLFANSIDPKTFISRK